VADPEEKQDELGVAHKLTFNRAEHASTPLGRDDGQATPQFYFSSSKKPGAEADVPTVKGNFKIDF
jgi:hypothetical protein